MAIRTEEIVTQWNLETGQAAKSIDEIYKKVQNQNREEKKLETVRRALDKTTAQATKSTKAMTMATSALSHATGILLAGAMRRATSMLTGMVRAGIEWEGTVKGVEREVEALRKATDGIIGDRMLARVAEFQKQLSLTERQTQAITKAAVAYGRINKTDFDTSLKAVTDSVVNLNERALRKLGINLDLTGKSAEKKAKILAALSEKYADVTIKAENAGEQAAKLSASWDRLQATIGKTMLDTVGLGGAMAYMADQLERMQRGDIPEWAKSLIEIFAPGTRFNYQLSEWMKEKGWERGGVRVSMSEQYATSGADLARMMTRTAEDRKAPKAAKAGGRVAPTVEPRSTEEGFKNYQKSMDQLKQLEDRALGLSVALAEAQIERDKLGMPTGAMTGFNDALAAGTMLADEQREALQKTVTEAEKYKATMEATSKSISDMAVGAFANLAGSMWAAADAALQGGQSFGKAMAQMTKAVLLGVAQQATVMGMMQLAEAAAKWWTGGGAMLHLKAAGMFFATAAVAGGAGLAMSAGGVGRSSGASSSMSRRDSTGRPSFGERKSKEQQTIVVNLYLDPNDPSSQLIAGRKLSAMTRQAMAA
jgi:hypothetical protein